MSNFNLYIGQKVNLIKEKNSSGPKYKAEVIGINSNSIDLQLLDFGAKQIKSLSVGEDYIIFFEGSNALYELDVKIKKITNLINKVLVVNPIGNLKKTERRRYMRVQVRKKIKYKLLDQTTYSDAVMINISGSGIKIEVDSLTNFKLEKNIKIDFSDIDSFPILEAEGRILRIKVDQNSRGSRIKYHLGVEFVSLAKQQKEKLINWVQQKKN